VLVVVAISSNFYWASAMPAAPAKTDSSTMTVHETRPLRTMTDLRFSR
jgi:hypothetical protein